MWLNELLRSLDLTTHTSLSPIRRGFAPGFVNYKKGALDLQQQVIKFTCCLPMVGGSLSTTASSTTKSGRLDMAEILLKVALITKNQIILEAFKVIFLLCYFFFIFLLRVY